MATRTKELKEQSENNERTINKSKEFSLKRVNWPLAIVASCRSIMVGQCHSIRNILAMPVATEAFEAWFSPATYAWGQDQHKNKAWCPLWGLWRQNCKNFSLFRLLFGSWLMFGLWSYAYAHVWTRPFFTKRTNQRTKNLGRSKRKKKTNIHMLKGKGKSNQRTEKQGTKSKKKKFGC